MARIELEQVAVGWPGQPPAVDGLSLTIAPGDKLVLLGANGCGKSTLLKLLNGLVFASAGQCRYDGVELTPAKLRERGFARRFRQEVALLFQQPDAMLFNPTVLDEIAYGPRRLGLPDADERARAQAGALRLDALLDKPPFQLSGGEKQKVALAAVLVLQPRVLLLDEPTANLDPRTAGWLAEHLLDTTATVVTSTHDLALADELGDRCLVFGPGWFHAAPVHAVLADLPLLESAGLAHRHRHRHGQREHGHLHAHHGPGAHRHLGEPDGAPPLAPRRTGG
ncbi:MAG TPA: ABC transporter ATP-binding protein [Pseudorhodoferax sp.]|nr:ABC transporter ATP-binding protein [Pseudorhodoferax sp.]